MLTIAVCYVLELRNIICFPTIKGDMTGNDHCLNTASIYQNDLHSYIRLNWGISLLGRWEHAVVHFNIMTPCINLHYRDALKASLTHHTLVWIKCSVTEKKPSLVKKVKKNWNEFEFQLVNSISIMQYLWVIAGCCVRCEKLLPLWIKMKRVVCFPRLLQKIIYRQFPRVCFEKSCKLS